jgi:hypothetical protein
MRLRRLSIKMNKEKREEEEKRGKRSGNMRSKGGSHSKNLAVQQGAQSGAPNPPSPPANKR